MTLGDLARTLPTRSQTTADTVAIVLREGIARGILTAGQPLRGAQIAAQLGVSRIPVREALKQLESEGLVTIYPNRGAVVTVLTPEEVREIYDIRKLLESEALRQAIPHLTDQALREAEALLAAYEQTQDTLEWAEIDQKFHTLLGRTANRPRLQGLIASLRTHVDRYSHLYGLAMRYRGVFERQHRELLRAARERDTERAVQVLREQLDYTAELLIRHMNGTAGPEDQG